MRAFFLSICYLSFSLSSFAETIHYEGSSTIGKYISDAEKVYRIVTFEKNVDSESLGGLQCAKWGSCELGGMANQLDEEDKNGINAYLIGYDAIAVIVHQRNPLNHLTRQQIQDIFSGRIKNWSQLGGDNLPVKVYTVQDASATRHVFKRKILGSREYAGTEIISPDRRIISKVTHDWGGIGQISFAFLENQKGVKPVNIDRQSASVNNPNYQITRPLYLLTHGEPKAKVKQFLDWTLSEQGQKVVRKKFVGVQ